MSSTQEDMEATKLALAKDINNLVALVSKTILYSTTSFHQRLTNQPSAIFSQRTTVQDAIATLLLDGRRGEVYAVALQLDIDHDISRDAIVLYISTKSRVSLSTTAYLVGIWELMQRRAEDFEVLAADKKAFELQHVHLTEEEQSALPEPTVASDNYHKLMRRVYTHCFRRWLKCIRRSYPEVAKFNEVLVQVLTEEIEESTLDSDWWLQPLICLMEQFDWVYKTAEELESQGKNPVGLVDLEEFPGRMEELDSAYRLLEGDTDVSEMILGWNARCENPEKSIFWHFRKFADFQIAIAQLDRFTHPWRFKRYKGKPLEIAYIDDLNMQPILTNLPANAAEWEEVMAKVLEYTRLEIKEEDKHLFRSVYNKLAAKVTSRQDHHKTALHPPTQLLLFLTTNPVYPPPLGQIGCSQAPCAACAAIFTAWWALNTSPCFTSRASDGWYPFKWSVLTEWKELGAELEVELLKVVYDRIAERFALSLMDLELVRLKESEGFMEGLVQEPAGDVSVNDGEEDEQGPLAGNVELMPTMTSVKKTKDDGGDQEEGSQPAE